MTCCARGFERRTTLENVNQSGDVLNNEIEIRPSNLPANIQDLSTFVLVGREKLTAVRAEIRAINRLALAEEVRAQKVEEARMISEALLDAEVRIGEMTKQIPKSSGGRPKKLPTPLSQVSHEEDGYFKNDTGVDFDSRKSKQEVVRDLGFSPKQVERMEILADNPDVVEEVKTKALMSMWKSAKIWKSFRKLTICLPNRWPAFRNHATRHCGERKKSKVSFRCWHRIMLEHAVRGDLKEFTPCPHNKMKEEVLS